MGFQRMRIGMKALHDLLAALPGSRMLKGFAFPSKGLSTEKKRDRVKASTT